MAISPMMQHYLQVKEGYPDTFVFYRLGDFYELFNEDAESASRLLGLTLTGKDCGLEKRAPMCGVPHKAADQYISKLIEMGYKVAVCEQLSEPQAGKIVERDVVRIITPGTVIDTEMLDANVNSYISAIYKEKNNVGISSLDITTGEFFIAEFEGNDVLNKINDFLVMIKPKEIICNSDMFAHSNNLSAVIGQVVPKFNKINDEYFNYKNAVDSLLNQLKSDNLREYNCATKHFAIISAGAMLKYIYETQKRDLSHINSFYYFEINNFMQLDANSRQNLELTESLREKKRKGTLFWVLDKTKTSMGSRTLKSYIEKPLNDDKLINYRLNGVEELIGSIISREKLRENLYNVFDIERLAGKISYGNITPKDCLALSKSLSVLPQIKNELGKFNSLVLKDILADLFDYSALTNIIDSAIDENVSNNFKDGGFIKVGYNAELDEYLNISKSGKNWLAELELKEKNETGIKNLKISYNKVFGYYIEVTNSQKELVPYRFQRKQTLTNAERFITDELKQIEDKILNAEDKKIQLEFELFADIRNKLLNYIKNIQKSAKALAMLDVLLSFATVSVENNYVKPNISKKNDCIEIVNGRHPVVETLLKGNNEFVPNDTLLNNYDSRTMIITGPNMAGKSTYMRQVAVIVLMAHIGCYVPANSCKLGLVDRIFTRIGARDDLVYGQSTFMVEMLEVSNILKYATNNSLIILDEVGRGTSTFDGLSIAWSVMEYISKNLLSKTLFATHFHELTDLEGLLDGVKNYRVNVKEFNNSIVFLRKIVRGGANKSFGIEVASLAELPKEVIDRAKILLHNLEQNEINKNTSLLVSNTEANTKINKSNINNIIGVLSDLNINTLSPISAFEILIQLKKYLEKE